MLKTTVLSKELALKAFRANNNKIIGGGDRADKIVLDSSKSKNKKFRKLTHMPNIRATRKPNFLTPMLRKPLTIYG